MSLSETEYIEICKKQLEEKFSFGNGHGYTQKDLELLSNHIETQKGVYISLSTLKRLWKNDFKQGPQLATLNALVGVLDYDNWQNFKLQNKKAAKDKKQTSFTGSKLNRRWKLVVVLVLPILPLLIYAFIKKTNYPKSNISINGTVIFEADKTKFKGVPNTAIFKYDVSNIMADSFFIQQSWNKWRKEKIDPRKRAFSSIYFESGFHRAKLIANDTVVSVLPIHVLSDGWEPHVYYDESDARFIDFHGESFINEGVLHLSDDLLEKKKVDFSRDFITRISNSRVFNTSSSNFGFSTRVKVDPVSTSNCPWLIVQIVSEKHIFYVKLVRMGCETNAAYKLGEINRRGKDSDLSFLGQNLLQWQEIGIEVRNKKAQIIINGKPVYHETFQEDFGEIMGLAYIFDGKGSINSVKLSDASGNTAFEDNFGN